ncbi:hypothetical protein [Marinitenerispora sediminis]|uniref:Uncharacterized protein n=1 Tax=Marinitenerispora sediminis TaxID=1931232 RepID=A0A368T968_9ACTN|nr:hypothetical protein [Marinitenerispora sediminis]RCV53521.1 hypothetical protein DEF28_10335 [Marinitenerispora sediminis]RCV57678.1 hypothetical protein DEF23_10220 [Marinitenerispora sediminis]RCV60766.1 hypothetical protein DEF24_06225 [Marinitenerispora sediminis]
MVTESSQTITFGWCEGGNVRSGLRIALGALAAALTLTDAGAASAAAGLEQRLRERHAGPYRLTVEHSTAFLIDSNTGKRGLPRPKSTVVTRTVVTLR